MLNTGHGEPVAHQLLVEAFEQSRSNPRGAFVLAVAAAEVGVKQYAARGGESESWLLSELPSPPLTKLLKDYLPLLTTRRTTNGEVIPRSIRASLDSAVQTRNKIVHRGAGAPSSIVLTELLATVNDLLYLLDWLSGSEWAFDLVRPNVRQEWAQ
jgi:hypothetical protein